MFEKRFAPARHVLQSAAHAMKTGQPERTIFACLVHDVVQNLIKSDHGYWRAQLFEPYVDERISWGVRYHQSLRFFADESVGYEYPEMYNRIFGVDYEPDPYIHAAHEYARNHRHYMEARLVTMNDQYAFDPDAPPISPMVCRRASPSTRCAYGSAQPQTTRPSQASTSVLQGQEQRNRVAR